MKAWLRWLLVVVVIASAAGGVWLWQKSHAAPAVQWKTQKIDKRSLVAHVTASGTLQATVTVQVGAQVSGRITELHADFNSTVKKGQLLAKLDPLLFQAAVEQARANYSSAKASVTRAQAQEHDAALVLARTKALAEQSLASSADLQTADTAVTVAKASTEVSKASLDQATAALHQVQVNLSYALIYSPIDGTVISRSVDVGQTVAASLQAPVLFTIAEDLRKMQVHTSVAEGDVGRLSAGMDATFTVDAFPGQKFHAKVSQIRNAAQTVQNVVTYDAVLDVDNTDLRLRPGMTATINIIWAQKDDALAVSNAALRFTPSAEVQTALGLPPAPSASVARPAHMGVPVGGANGGGAQGAGAPSAPGGGRSPGGGSKSRAGNVDPSSNESRTVYLLRNAKPEPVAVRTGLSDGTSSEIVSGEVAEGDEVITDAIVAGKSSVTPTGTGAPPGGAAPRMGRLF